MSVINDPEPIIQSSVLGTHIEFNLSLMCQILELPNIGDHCYLTVVDNLPTYGRTKSED